MLEIKLTIDEVDYDKVIEKLFPIISEQLEESLKNKGFFGNVFGGLFGATKRFTREKAKELFASLSDDKKEKLIVFCLNGKCNEIENLLVDALTAQELSMQVGNFRISQVGKS